MASSSSSSADSLISIKVSYDGVHKRFKLPLHYLVVNTLEEKFRQHLEIPDGTEVTIERFSDSGGSYGVLDQDEMPNYKQLYRAAKAKRKLKFRVTTKEKEQVYEEPVHEEQVQEEKRRPMPVTVEDEAEDDTPQPIIRQARVRVSGGVKTDATPNAKARSETVSKSHDDKETIPERLIVNLKSAKSVPPTAARKSSKSKASDTSSTALPMSIDAIKHEQTLMEQTIANIEASVAAMSLRNKNMGQGSVQKAAAAEAVTYSICCNSCDQTIPDAHYHCATCDEGDFDLCQPCVHQGISCYGSDHWLIKRYLDNGKFVNSTTERLAPKSQLSTVGHFQTWYQETDGNIKPAPERTIQVPSVVETRICNSCLSEQPATDYVHCTTCRDFDLCSHCFTMNDHGHHPNHGFAPAVLGGKVMDDKLVTFLMDPGRNVRHYATCDGCDDTIRGIRHKCMDCPDWDYCSTCVSEASHKHPGHRFVPIYERLENRASLHARTADRPMHTGVCCDGPLCVRKSQLPGNKSYIIGDRYKCAVCHDTDFCANCEASPANKHNRTHPLVKFKSPVRHANIITTGDQPNGKPMRVMGDRIRRFPGTLSRATETTKAQTIICNAQTVVDVKPEPDVTVKTEESQVVREAPAPHFRDLHQTVVDVKPEPDVTVKMEKESQPVPESPVPHLCAVYKGDTVADGTVMVPKHHFQQTWFLRNEGNVPWPAGCSVKYTGGDYMGRVDPNHPAATAELVSSSETTISYTPVLPGQVFPFTILLRSPGRDGRFVSHWRLTGPGGLQITGPRLWCDIVVQGSEHREIVPVVTAPEGVSATVSPKTEQPEEIAVDKQMIAPPQSLESSQMIFPKLETESPVSSTHLEPEKELTAAVEHVEDAHADDVDEEWAEDDSFDGFLTDEEYDILDASDEEFLDEQAKKQVSK